MVDSAVVDEEEVLQEVVEAVSEVSLPGAYSCKTLQRGQMDWLHVRRLERQDLHRVQGAVTAEVTVEVEEEQEEDVELLEVQAEAAEEVLAVGKGVREVSQSTTQV